MTTVRLFLLVASLMSLLIGAVFLALFGWDLITDRTSRRRIGQIHHFARIALIWIAASGVFALMRWGTPL
jgi:hypothetical protein